MDKKIVKIFFVLFFISLIFFIYFHKSNEKKTEDIDLNQNEDDSYSSNIIENVNYTSTDTKGNRYIINATKGEVDFSNNNIIYLTNVNAVIKLSNSNDIKIKSDFGKYNTLNFDTIFSKNVIIKYLENKINGEYLDFSIKRNSMIVSKNVVYTNLNNILKADVIEIDIQSKDTKIFMHDSKKKVNIKSKD